MIKHHFSIKTLGMRGKTLHQLWTLDPIGICRPVIDLGGGHELTSLGKSGDHNGVEVGAGRINGGGVACRPRTQNKNFGMFWC